MLTIINDLFREICNYTYPACLLTVMLCVGFLFMHEQDAHKKLFDLWHKRKKLVLLMFYLAFLLMATVFGRQTTNPYRSIFEHLFFKSGNAEWNKEILENTLIFIPLSFLFLNSFTSPPRKPCQMAVMFVFRTSLFIELSQLLFWLGEFQFSDIVYNTIGGLLGFGVWQIYCYVRGLRQKKK